MLVCLVMDMNKPKYFWRPSVHKYIIKQWNTKVRCSVIQVTVEFTNPFSFPLTFWHCFHLHSSPCCHIFWHRHFNTIPSLLLRENCWCRSWKRGTQGPKRDTTRFLWFKWSCCICMLRTEVLREHVFVNEFGDLCFNL